MYAMFRHFYKKKNDNKNDSNLKRCINVIRNVEKLLFDVCTKLY